MNKTVWYPGDIITTEKWNKINNNLSILGALQLQVTEIENEESSIARENINSGSIYTINKSYKEVIDLIKKGVLCYIVMSETYTKENTVIAAYYNIEIATSYNSSSHAIFFTHNSSSHTTIFYDDGNGGLTTYDGNSNSGIKDSGSGSIEK